MTPTLETYIAATEFATRPYEQAALIFWSTQWTFRDCLNRGDLVAAWKQLSGMKTAAEWLLNQKDRSSQSIGAQLDKSIREFGARYLVEIKGQPQ